MNDLDRWVATVIAEMSTRLGEESQHIRTVLEDQISELEGDPQLLQLLGASIEGNVDTVFHVLQHGISADHLEAPAAAMEYSRRLAQRGVPVTALVRAYRLGQSTLLDRIFDDISRSPMDPPMALQVCRRIVMVASIYIDWISEQVVTEYQNERERWLANRSNVRAVRIRELLSDAAPDEATFSESLGYPLAQHHCAAILWLRDPETGADPDGLGQLSRATSELARIMRSHGEPLFVAADQLSAWAWIPLGANSRDVDLDEVSRHVDASEQRAWSMTIGNPGYGGPGFRRSHLQAQQARSVVTLRGSADRFTAYGRPGVAMVGLMAADLPAARVWMREVLGPLADTTAQAAQLRDTLRAYLSNNRSHKATAAQLHLHYNTVKYRVKSAERERGRPLDDDRLDLEMALLLHRWIADAGPGAEH
ncbi:MAG: hypothetical protein JWR37_225 [Mycobacterium sp.]|nr:hypothetical protein [Mycobacterium sp.]